MYVTRILHVGCSVGLTDRLTSRATLLEWLKPLTKPNMVFDSLTSWRWNDERIRDEMISSQSKTALHSAKTDKLYFWKCCQLLLSNDVMLLLPTTEDEGSSRQLKPSFSHLCVCVCVCVCALRNATGEWCWDDVPLCYLHLHKAASRWSSGLQRWIPEGKRIIFIHQSSLFSLHLSFHTIWTHFFPLTPFPSIPVCSPSLFLWVSETLRHLLASADERWNIIDLCVCVCVFVDS